MTVTSPAVDLQPTDLVLVARTRVDSHAFEQLFERYWERVFRFCYLRTNDWHVAEDLASQTFLNAFAALPGFHGQSDSAFRCWLFTIARNAVSELHRKRYRHPVEQLEIAEQLESSDLSLDELAISREQYRRLLDLMSRLPAEQREMLEMRAAGLNSNEIAQILGKSHAAVRQAQWRAVNTLRSEMTDADPANEGMS